MDELKEDYYELNNLIDNLEMAVKECKNSEYKSEIIEIMARIKLDIEELQKKITQQENLEKRELINQYERDRI